MQSQNQLDSKGTGGFHKLLKLEMDGNVFKYFNQFFSFNFPKELFTKQDTKEIMQTIRQKIDPQYNDYIIMIGRDMSYYVQVQKNQLLIAKIADLAIFIYKPKYLVIPSFSKLEQFTSIDRTKIEYFKQKVTLCFQRDFDSQPELQQIHNIQEFICKFFIKYEDHQTLSYNHPEFEKLFIQKLKNVLIMETKLGNWNIFMGKKLEGFYQMIDSNENRKVLIFDLDFKEYYSSKYKKQVVMFFQKGVVPSITSKIYQNIAQFIIFLSLAGMFIVSVTCKDSNQSSQPVTVRDQICEQKPILIAAFCCIFFMLFFRKIVKKIKERKQREKKKQQ